MFQGTAFPYLSCFYVERPQYSTLLAILPLGKSLVYLGNVICKFGEKRSYRCVVHQFLLRHSLFPSLLPYSMLSDALGVA